MGTVTVMLSCIAWLVVVVRGVADVKGGGWSWETRLQDQPSSGDQFSREYQQHIGAGFLARYQRGSSIAPLTTLLICAP